MVVIALVWRCSRDSGTATDIAIKPIARSRARLRDLAQQKPASIAGRITADGKPATAAIVCTHPNAHEHSSSGDDREIVCVTSGGDGRYAFAELHAASYTVWASLIGALRAPRPAGVGGSETARWLGARSPAPGSVRNRAERADDHHVGRRTEHDECQGEFLIQGLAGKQVTISAGDRVHDPDVSLVEVKTVTRTGSSPIDVGDLIVPAKP